MAQKFGLHPSTFNKYIDISISNGYITSLSNNRYVVSKFSDIFKENYNRTGLFFGKHSILESETINFKKVLSEIEQILFIDNVINPQKHKIELKKRFNSINSKVSRTGKEYIFKADIKFYLKERKNIRKNLRNQRVEKNYAINERIITSCRHTAKNIGIGTKKAGRMINACKSHKRNIMVKWIHGVSFFSIEKAKMKYPKALVIPMPYYNKIKVSFGSEMVPSK